MNLRHYIFRNEWDIDAKPDDVFVVLENVPDYPKWFPLIKEVKQLERPGKFWYRSRSILPYDLTIVSEQRIVDPEKRVLEASLEGEMIGYSRWTITPRGKYSTVEYFQEVDTNKALLDRLAPIAKPLFKLNHAYAMRLGKRGLQTYMAGFVAPHESVVDREKKK